MLKKQNNKTLGFTILILVILLVGAVIPIIQADSLKGYKGFDKGPSYKPVVPLKKLTFVNFDEETYLDDYAYLSSIPTSIFYDEATDNIYSHPLLFYQDELVTDNDKYRSLDAYQGIKYFTEDWMGYCNNNLDKLTAINVNEREIRNLNEDIKTSINTRETVFIDGDDPYELANKIALEEWSYSNDAVVAVVEEEYEAPNEITHGLISGEVPKLDGVITEHFEVPQTNDVNPFHNEFDVPEGYKLIDVRAWYPCFYLQLGIPGFESIINMSIPAGDRDIQIYCEYDNKWMMTGITTTWNALDGMDMDKASVYAYKSGKWSVALTDVPTKTNSIDLDLPDDLIKSGLEVQKHRSLLNLVNWGRYGNIFEILQNLREVTYQIDVEMYPGTMIEVPDLPTFGCKNAQFELTWDDPSANLGFSLIGPSGEEVLSTRDVGVITDCHFSSPENKYESFSGEKTGMRVERLGELNPGEKYSICVFSNEELSKDVEYSIEYSWQQNYSRMEGDCLASATNGAVLSSILNAPLLYAEPSDIPDATQDALLKLGVDNIYVVDLGGYLSSDAKQKIKDIGDLHKHFVEYDELNEYIREKTNQNDVIFSTVDPYSYWYVGELKVAGEMLGALSIGPAAYIAAHHGSPVILVDNHPELSSALTWYNEFWRRYPDGIIKLPTTSEMYLTGTRIYDFLKSKGYDKEGYETIITVGGQFDIGLAWDRVFVGKANPGRFFGCPTDLSVWLSKSVFYPQLVFESPAIENPNGVTLINGSSSERRFPWRGTLGLKITKPSQEETFKYPVLDTLVCYEHKFNTRASDYWGFQYKTADGEIPGVTQSFEPIDEGVMEAVNGEKAGYLADLSGGEVQPFYIERAGYDPVFSTNFQANMNNLNEGVLLWLINTHGGPAEGGMLMFWDVNNENPFGYPTIPLAGYNKEDNPWRAYEWWMGSTEEPDTMTSDVNGILPALLGNPDPKGIRLLPTALDWALAYRPLRDLIGNIASLPGLRLVTPDWLQNTQDYYDGVILTVFLGRFGTSWYNGTQIDKALDNIHSVGVSSVACLPAGKHLHLSLMRHGSVFQIMDPWKTSWYSSLWQNAVPRGIALGETIGDIYREGISKVGILYLTDEPQWWWDNYENVCLYGDPDLRVWCPSTEWDFEDNNNWDSKDIKPLEFDDELSINGHMPFGVTEYPHEKQPKTWIGSNLIVIVILVLIIILLILMFAIIKRK